MQKEQFEVKGATVPFHTYSDSGITYYEFDTSLSGPPDPMVNAMCGLKLLDSPDKRLVMINMKMPMGLFPKIENDFSWISEALGEDKVKVVFSLKGAEATQTDFSSQSCDG